jgi:phenylpropionate dioxygenase-like ring-hydroxylating dioxygenase large terminal subunit
MDIENLIVEDPQREIFRVHRSVMTAEEILELERKCIFDQCWLYIGHDSEIETPGDFRRREVGGRPLIFLRGKDNVIRVFYNSCTHWGAKVCRLDQGNAETFQCFYHAWTFNNLGQLIGIPDAAGYPENLDRGALALKPVPRLDSYRGLYFVSFNADVEPLGEYLTGAREYIDLILDQAETGMRVVAGTQLYTVRANWKLVATNSLDSYHAPALHQTYFNYVAQFKGTASKQETKEAPMRMSGYGRSLGNGHGVSIIGNPGGLPRPIASWHPLFGEAAREEIAQVRARIVERVGAERAELMCNTFRLFLIYPNFVFHDVPAITIRYIEPVAPDATRLTVYALAPKEESKSQVERRLDNFLSFLGPGGFAHPDDLEAIESCQDAFRSQLDWSDFSKGMHRDPEAMDEAHMRAFWRQWHAQLLGLPKAARWDDLKMAHNGRAAAVQ